jgi:integrase
MADAARFHSSRDSPRSPDRALIAALTYSFARINAALQMNVEDLRPRAAGWTIRRHEKGGKHHAMPRYHALAETLHAYINAAGIAEDRKGWLFRTSRGHDGNILSGLCHGNSIENALKPRLATRHAAATASCHSAVASAKIRSVDREMRWR